MRACSLPTWTVLQHLPRAPPTSFWNSAPPPHWTYSSSTWISPPPPIQPSRDQWPSAWAPIATPALRRERAFRSKERHNNSILSATGSCFAWPIAILEATSRWLRRTRSPRGAAQAFVGMKSRAPMRPRRSSNPAHLHLIRNLAGCRVSPWTKREISPSATAFPAATCSPPLSTPGAYRAMHWEPWKAKLRFLPDWGHKQAG